MCDDASAAAPPFLLMGWCSRLHACRIRLCLLLSWVWVRGRACLFAVPMSALSARGPSASSASRLLGPFSPPASQWHLTAASEGAEPLRGEHQEHLLHSYCQTYMEWFIQSIWTISELYLGSECKTVFFILETDFWMFARVSFTFL